jgi:uncharacterized Zn finger protein
MATNIRTWWGNRFIEALKQFMDDRRLARGRSYSKPDRILRFSRNLNLIDAVVRGNINPYFGVYKEPRYKVTIKIQAISKKKWPVIIDTIAKNIALLSRLVLGEMPENIEDAFHAQKTKFLPRDFNQISTSCTCPDWVNPCKHIAGVYFKCAEILDNDPFLLFELRGIPRDLLIDELRKTKLGEALAKSLEFSKKEINLISKTYFTVPKRIKLDSIEVIDDFWGRPFDDSSCNKSQNSISALLIKKEGDFPSFWKKNASFIGQMEAIYTFIKQRNNFSKSKPGSIARVI